MAAPLLIIAACILAMALRVSAVWGALPSHLASHFGPSGQANGFSDAPAFFVLYALIGTLTVGGLLASSLLIRALPDKLINLPNRDYWLAPERKARALSTLTRWSAWCAVWLTLLLCAVLELVLRANLAQGPLDNTLFVALLVTFMTGMLGGLVWLVRAFAVPS